MDKMDQVIMSLDPTLFAVEWDKNKVVFGKPKSSVPLIVTTLYNDKQLDIQFHFYPLDLNNQPKEIEVDISKNDLTLRVMGTRTNSRLVDARISGLFSETNLYKNVSINKGQISDREFVVILSIEKRNLERTIKDSF